MKQFIWFRPLLIVGGLLLGHSATAQQPGLQTTIQLANASLSAVAVPPEGGWHNTIPMQFDLDYTGQPTANFDFWGARAPRLGATRLHVVANLFQAYLPAASTYLLTLSSFQLVAWEMTNEANTHFYALSGSFLSVTFFNDTDTHALFSNLDQLTGGSYQHVVMNTVSFVADQASFAPVPEPSTYSLMAGSLVALAIGWRKRRSQPRTGTVLTA